MTLRTVTVVIAAGSVELPCARWTRASPVSRTPHGERTNCRVIMDGAHVWVQGTPYGAWEHYGPPMTGQRQELPAHGLHQDGDLSRGPLRSLLPSRQTWHVSRGRVLAPLVGDE